MCIFRDRSCIHMMIFTGITTLFAIISSKACDRIPTVEQQNFCSAKYGKLGNLCNNGNSFYSPASNFRDVSAILIVANMSHR